MSRTFHISLTFEDIQRLGKSLSGTDEYVEYAIDSVHSGATYPGTITMDHDSAIDFQRMMNAGLQVVFWTARREEVRMILSAYEVDAFKEGLDD